uniref:Abl-interactor homeo-domain homologous domain-containing protein n=1 Tax=Laticauda laticaudata TaxID=8630 RepID=A0A8C5S484_LATLA
MSEFQQLMQDSIPSARDVLQENYSNLLKVADYCDSNYEQAQDKRKALEETMAFTVQSLASVTYQINNLARNILKIFDLQTTHLQQMEASVCSIEQVKMHKEKVSRREIGMLTVCKTFPQYQKIMYPKKLEPLQPYYRKPLDFSALDDIGHGIKSSPPLPSRFPDLGNIDPNTCTSVKDCGSSSQTILKVVLIPWASEP